MEQLVANFKSAQAKDEAAHAFRRPPVKSSLNPQDIARQQLLVARAELRQYILNELNHRKLEAAKAYFVHARSLIAAFEDLFAADLVVTNLTGSVDYDVVALAQKLFVPAPPPSVLPDSVALMQDAGVGVVKVVPGGLGALAHDALRVRALELEQQTRSNPDLQGAWPF